MRRLFLAMVVALVGFAVSSAAAEEAKKPLKVVILSGSKTYRSDLSLPPFQKWLEGEYNVQCKMIQVTSDDDLPGLEALDDCDVLFVYIKRMKLKGDQLERFKKYVTSGKPIVGVRTASHAVQTWLEFDTEVLGGNYKGHTDKGPITQIEITPEGAKHPILQGVEGLTTTDEVLYRNAGHAPDINILAKGTIPNAPTEPIAWTREYKGGRIFYTSLGAENTFEKPGFRRMLANALFWTAKREVEPKKQVASK